MWPNSQFPANFVTFNEEILNGNFIACAVLESLRPGRHLETTKVTFSEYNALWFEVKLDCVNMNAPQIQVDKNLSKTR